MLPNQAWWNRLKSLEITLTMIVGLKRQWHSHAQAKALVTKCLA